MQLTKEQLLELRYLKKREPQYVKMPPERARAVSDHDLVHLLENRLIRWQPNKGYFITPDGREVLRNYLPDTCPHCGKSIEAGE